jgi:hypothetical protein
MAMSRDRILFWPHGPTGGRFSTTDQQKKNERATEHALRVACSLSAREVEDSARQGRGILARPSQFARFVVLRENMGGQNIMKGMCMKALSGLDCIEVARYSKIIDVSHRDPAPNLIGAGLYSVPTGTVEAYGHLQRRPLKINRVPLPHELIQDLNFPELYGKDAVQAGVSMHAAAERAQIVGFDMAAPGSDMTVVQIGAPSRWRAGRYVYAFKNPTVLTGEDAKWWVENEPVLIG